MMFKQLAVLALAGTAVAAPTLVERDWQGGYGHWPSGGWRWGGQPSESAAPVASETPAPSPAPAPSPSSSYSPPAQSSAAPVASATASPSTGSSTDDYMSVVNEWRAKGGYSALTQDSTLEANAQKTVNDDNGVMKHELNPGSMAQVLAPGDASNFESVYVGGWLCEVPTLPGLDGICSSMAQGWDHSDGETGHADILTSSSYSKIGCALADGIWGCDLA